MKKTTTISESEQQYLTILNSLSDAINLRDNKAINEFRSEVFEMSEKVKNGKMDEMQIKKRINKANRILELSNLAGPIGKCITIGGISGFCIPILGKLLTISGVCVIAAEKISKKKYNWALVSNK